MGSVAMDDRRFSQNLQEDVAESLIRFIAGDILPGMGISAKVSGRYSLADHDYIQCVAPRFPSQHFAA